jgi:hypothetical protein
MTNKLPTVDIKGKDYVMVKDRVLYFNETFKNGSIVTEIISPIESQTVIVKAIVIPNVENPERKFIDFSQAVIGQGFINTTSALENASTSAVGRALAYMGIGVIESIASADELKKAISSEPQTKIKDEHVDFGSGQPKYKCEICHTTDPKAHRPDCKNNPNITIVNKGKENESFGTKPI